MLFFMLL